MQGNVEEKKVLSIYMKTFMIKKMFGNDGTTKK